MSYNEWHAAQLIEGIRIECRLVRESLEIGCIGPALSSLERLQELAEALYNSHVSMIHQQLSLLEPLLRSLDAARAPLQSGGEEGPGRGNGSPGGPRLARFTDGIRGTGPASTRPR
jgi:hypothetical protein